MLDPLLRYMPIMFFSRVGSALPSTLATTARTATATAINAANVIGRT